MFELYVCNDEGRLLLSMKQTGYYDFYGLEAGLLSVPRSQRSGMKGAETQVNMVVVRRQRHPALSGLPACSLLTLCLSCTHYGNDRHIV